MRLSFIKNKIEAIKHNQALFEKNIINSFDIFDTIIGRRCSDIFEEIENTFPYPGFKKLRESIYDIPIDEIYKKLENYIDKNICKKLYEFEIETELKNTYLIHPNYNKVKDGDILVSDMYYTKEIILKILKNTGFYKNVTIYVTPSGKYTGSIWNTILKTHIIGIHYGDNLYSDVLMPRKYGVKTIHSTIHEFSKTEKIYLKYGLKKQAYLLREFRHRNPYDFDTLDFKLYNDQAEINIPILIAISRKLYELMVNENRKTLLCQTRDGCFLQHIFKALYPTLTCKSLETSRHIYSNPNDDYKKYLKSIYNHTDCIIFDLDGAFKSGRELYKELFDAYPRVHLFLYYSNRAPIYEGLTYSIIDKYPFLNSYNVDTVGTLLEYKNNIFIRKSVNYSIEKALLYKKTIVDFCEFLKINIELFILECDLLPEITSVLIHNSNFIKDMED